MKYKADKLRLVYTSDMYFKSRAEAGKQLAAKLEQYRYEDCAVVALSDGGVVVGAQIAASLHCPLMLLLVEDITFPGETGAVGVIDQNGAFTYNDMFSAGELEEIAAEYHTVIEQQKIEKWHQLNRLLSDGGIIDAAILKNRNVIVVSDGLTSGLSLAAVAQFLKPISIQKLILATPLASVSAVDKMHLLADKLEVLSVFEGDLGLDHYYETNDVPDRNTIIRLLNETILKWR